MSKSASGLSRPIQHRNAGEWRADALCTPHGAAYSRAVLARLILALLLAAFAMPAPAAAACHETAVARHHAMPMPAQDEEPAAAAPHGCIGCIPPGDWLGARVAAPMMVGSVPLVAGPATLDLGGSDPPAIPPPRHG